MARSRFKVTHCKIPRQLAGQVFPSATISFACRLGPQNRLIGKWPGVVRTRISTVLLLSFRLRQPPRAVADEHLFEFGAGTGRDVRDHWHQKYLFERGQLLSPSLQ